MGFFDSTTITEGAMYAKLDIMDLVENTDIRNLPMTSSLVEDALIGIAESEENYNNIMKACAYNELVNFQENGTEYVFTEASAGGFIATAKQFFANIWQKIQALFKKFAIMIGRFVQDDKTFVEKNKATIVAGLANIPKDAKFKGYKFDGLSKWDGALRDMTTQIKIDLSTVDSHTRNAGNNKPTDDYNRDEVNAKLRAELVGETGEMTQSEFNKKLYEMFRGSDSKDDIDIDNALVNDAMATLTAAKKVRENSNKAYKELKKYFDKVDAALNKASANITKSYGKDGGMDTDTASNALVNLKRDIDYNKMLSSALQAGNGIYLTCLKDYSRQCKAICVRVATYRTPKNEGAGFTHYEGAGFLNNVVLK